MHRSFRFVELITKDKKNKIVLSPRSVCGDALDLPTRISPPYDCVPHDGMVVVGRATNGSSTGVGAARTRSGKRKRKKKPDSVHHCSAGRRRCAYLVGTRTPNIRRRRRVTIIIIYTCVPPPPPPPTTEFTWAADFHTHTHTHTGRRRRRRRSSSHVVLASRRTGPNRTRRALRMRYAAAAGNSHAFPIVLRG